MTFWGLVFWAPSAVRWSAFSFPVILACPLTHSKDVCPALFLSLFAIGFRRLAWEIFIKSLSVWDLMFSHSAFMAQAESVLHHKFPFSVCPISQALSPHTSHTGG